MADSFTPYVSRFEAPEGPGDKRPTWVEVLKDNDRIGDMQGIGAVVTGGTSGIGVETVRALYATGADVFFTARDMAKGAEVRQQIASTSDGKGRLEVIEMNMDSLESVRRAARDLLSRTSSLSILVNNAGIMGCPKGYTEDKFERQFGVNHLAHYLFTVLLLPALKSGSSPAFKSRVVFVSSSLHRTSQVLWDDCNFEGAETYEPYKAYGQSKTANIWTANYIDRVFGAQGVHATSLHPGGIWTGLQKSTDPALLKKWKADPAVTTNMLSPEQGAATTVWAAVGRVWEGRGGEYLADCTIAPPLQDLSSVTASGAAPWVKECESEDRLWKLSASLVGVNPEC